MNQAKLIEQIFNSDRELGEKIAKDNATLISKRSRITFYYFTDDSRLIQYNSGLVVSYSEKEYYDDIANVTNTFNQIMSKSTETI